MPREYLANKKNVISRPQFDRLLSNALEYPLITVVAAPGYGKSTAVGQFARKTKRRLVWVNLLPLDNDADRFWKNIVDASSKELPQLSEELEKTHFPSVLGEFDAVLRLVTKELYSGTEVLLVFNDIGCIENETILQFFNYLFRAELENLCIIIISNERLNPKLTVKAKQYLHVGASELQFDQAETKALFDSYGHVIEDAEAAQLTEHTGGWPLALHLIASRPNYSLRHQFGEAPYLQVIAELFEFNYFSNYDAPTQNLLAKLSFFQHITLGLVQAIGAEETDASTVLDMLIRNIFISYDYAYQRFYMQAMYRNFLTYKQATLSYGEVNALFSKAGEWYRANGEYFEALDCFWKAGNYDAFLRVVEEMPLSNRSTESASYLLTHLNQIPAEYAAHHPTVDYYRAIMCLKVLRIRFARSAFLQLIEQWERNENSADNNALLGDVYVGLVAVSLAQNEDGALGYAEKAASILRPGDRIRTLEITSVGNSDVFFLPRNERGQFAHVLEYMEKLVGHLNALDFAPGRYRGYADLFAAEGYFYAGQFTDCAKKCAVAIQYAKKMRQHDIVANAQLLLMRSALFAGDGEKARQLLDELSAYVNEHEPVRLLQLKDCAKGLFYLHMDDAAKAPYWLFGKERLPEDVTQDIGRDKVISALCQYVAKEYMEAYATVTELEGIFDESKFWGLQVIAHILKAVCLLQVDSFDKAVEEFYAAYDMTWQNDMLVPFAEFGKDTLALLDAVRKQSAYTFDAKWLEDVRHMALEHSIRESAMVKLYSSGKPGYRSHPLKLTPRETEVLTHMAAGLSREQIRAALGISINGVKKHITNIYNKLGAINKVDAIHIAAANGIIDPFNVLDHYSD